MPKTKEDRIRTVMDGGGSVVVFRASASIASTFRNEKLNGKNHPEWTISSKLLDLLI
jgi:mevalonate pyrophosphate decarboxylase